MKIGIIGPSTAGKTTMLGAFFDDFEKCLKPPGYDLTLEVIDAEKKTYLRFVRDKILAGQPLEGTMDIDDYPLAMRFNAGAAEAEMIGATITDFKGGALHSTDTNTETIQQNEKIVSGLSQCDGYIVLIDGNEIIEASQKDDPAHLENRVCSAAINNILNQALERRKKKLSEKETTDAGAYAFGHGLTPVAFVVTKSDLLTAWLDEKVALAKLQETLMKIFHNHARGNTDFMNYKDKERGAALFIRSQFPQIFNDPEIAKMRMMTCSHDIIRRTGNRINVADPFQFVLLIGMLNARDELKRRIGAWGIKKMMHPKINGTMIGSTNPLNQTYGSTGKLSGEI